MLPRYGLTVCCNGGHGTTRLLSMTYEGYRKKCSVLHSMGRYGEAFKFNAFEKMILLIMENSADQRVCGKPVGSNPHKNTDLCRFYTRVSKSIAMTPLFRRKVIVTTSVTYSVCSLARPLVVSTKAQQAAAFE
jgi:hypothetical protein